MIGTVRLTEFPSLTVRRGLIRPDTLPVYFGLTAARMPLAPGTRLGPYEILSPLGAGGMGEVYRARDPRLGRDVAIKVVLSGTADDPLVRERFEREARAVAALAHPNILAMFDVGTTADGVTFVVTELLRGETLRRRLAAGGPLPIRRALEYAAQVAHGLATAHERGIVHRDLKPENLFVTEEGRVKILDFGIAHWDRAGADAAGEMTVASTQPGAFLGTPAYVSPEQAEGVVPTPRSDVFSLGIVLHEMLSGGNPFARQTAFETLTAILREDAPPLDHVAGLPAGVARLVERCLQKRPGDRPGSAADLAFMLDTLGTRVEVPFPATLHPGDAHAPLPLRLRVALLPTVVVLIFVAATWVYVHMMSSRLASQQIDAELGRVQAIVARIQQERLTGLRLAARLVASFPELKALFETDTATIRDYLLAYQQRNPGTGILLAFDSAGEALARTDQPTVATEKTSLPALLNAPNAMSIVTLAGRPHHAAAAESEARGTVFGHVVAAVPVDGAFARAIGETIQDDVVLLAADQALGTTLRSGQAPWTSIAHWRAQGGRTDATVHVDVAGGRVAAREVILQRDPPVSAVLLKSDEDALDPYRRMERGIVLIGLAAIALTIAGSVWFISNRGRRT